VESDSEGRASVGGEGVERRAATVAKPVEERVVVELMFEFVEGLTTADHRGGQGGGVDWWRDGAVRATSVVGGRRAGPEGAACQKVGGGEVEVGGELGRRRPGGGGCQEEEHVRRRKKEMGSCTNPIVRPTGHAIGDDLAYGMNASI
jgi:hypothetical protein